MTSIDHLLTVVEPAGRDDPSLDLARDVVDRGGRASVVMLLTPRVMRDIAAFADAEDLDLPTAEAIVVEQLQADAVARVGSDVDVRIGRGRTHRVVAQVTPADATSIALPAALADRRTKRRLAASTGLPIVVTPAPAA